MCIQTMVDEVLLKNNGRKKKRPSDRQKSKKTEFLTRNKLILNKSDSISQNGDSETSSLASNANLPTDYSKNDLFENEDFITNDDL